MQLTQAKRRRGDLLTAAAVAALLAVMSVLLYTGSLTRQVTNTLVPTAVYIVMAVSLNLVVGLLGELSLGHAGFMSVGAYGAALFRHNGKRLQLTEAGEILRRTLLTMKHDEQHLQKRMQQAATGTRDYSFGATLSVAEFMLNEALGRFLHLHPDSRIRMQVADTKVLLSKLDSGELDFAVVEGDFPKAEYDFFVFGTEEYVAAAAPDKAARYRGRQLTQLLGEPLLLREEGSGTRVILEYYLKERGLAAADFARTVEIGNIGAIKTLLKSGYGVSFLYRAAIRPEEAAGTLGVIELSDFQLRHDIMFLFPKNSNFRADYTTIFQELRACAQPDGACACPEA